MKKNFLYVLCLIVTALSASAQNPIIYADVPDMSIIRVQDTYYMSSTTMHMSPGLPIMRSKDLVNWQMVGYAYDVLDHTDELDLDNGKSSYGKGSWASSLRYHDGRFYVSTFSGTTGKTYIYTTDNIEKGPWKAISFKPSLHDHSLFFDDDGKTYMIYGSGKIMLAELNDGLSGIREGTTPKVLIADASSVAGPNKGLPAEGSQLFRIDGKYYLFNITWPKGGMRTVTIHRSDNLMGPYEGRVALQDKGVAQGGLVNTPAGKWYAYLFRDFGAVGRVPYLVPVKWEDGWPVLGVDHRAPDTLDLPASKGLDPGIVASDEFSRPKGAPALPLVWQWNHNPDNNLWSLSQRPGYLRLTTGRIDTSIMLARNTLTQRTYGPGCSGTTAIDVSQMKDGDQAGIILLQKKYGWAGVRMTGNKRYIVMVQEGLTLDSTLLTKNTLYLRADCDFRGRADKGCFYYSLDGKTWTPIGGTLKMEYTLPHFMGYRFGLFNYATKTPGGFVDFDYFHLADAFSYRNPDLSAAERASDLIGHLTLEEKASLMQDQSPAIPRLGIKKFNWWSEALHGLANNQDVTVFPEPIGMAASFDDTLVCKVFNAVSDETRAKYNQLMTDGMDNKRFLSLSVWTPNINIFRDPRWGRGQETYGEDPYLTSRMGISVVKGLQGPADAKYRKLLACAKHFAVHSGPEWSRHQLNLNKVDPRDLWETYLPAFKALVTKADVREVMCAYQRLDDEPCCANNRLLQNILRDDWGFKYVVVSDCGAVTDFYTSHKVSSDAVHAAAKASSAGTDVECVWDGYAFKHLPEAVAKGLIKEKEIDAHLSRILTARFDLGEMDDDAIVPWTKIPAAVINSPENQDLALKISRESMTLLLNKDNILPISRSVKKIGVIGPNADNEPMLWGNYNGKPVHTTTILDGIRSKIGQDRIVYDKACDLVENKVTQSYFSRTSYEGKKGFKAVYWNNPGWQGDAVTTDRLDHPIKMTTAGDHEFASGVKLLGFSAIYSTEFISSETEEIVFKTGATGHFELLVNGATVAKHDNWRTLPSRTAFKVAKGEKYKIEIKYAQLNNWQADLAFDFGKEVDIDFSGLIEKLKGTEMVVFVGGLSTLLEGEEMPVNYPGFKGGDRTNIELPEVQRNCLKALRAAGKKIVFVNCSGSAIAMAPEKDACDAILQAWYGGQSGGQAVADVLLGEYNPSGKLPVTFYKNSEQLGDFEDYSMKGRTYRFMSDPLFAFGYGLSYTKFSIGPATTSADTVLRTDTLTLTIPVSNTGRRNGTEIVQVYIRKTDDVDGPVRTLRGFRRIDVPAGKTAMAMITLPYNAFEFYSKDKFEMTVTPGEYELWVGNSSATMDLKMTKIIVK